MYTHTHSEAVISAEIVLSLILFKDISKTWANKQYISMYTGYHVILRTKIITKHCCIIHPFWTTHRMTVTKSGRCYMVLLVSNYPQLSLASLYEFCYEICHCVIKVKNDDNTSKLIKLMKLTHPKVKTKSTFLLSFLLSLSVSLTLPS